MHAEEPSQEQARLAALDEYDILDTPSEEAFDRITRLVRRIFDVPMSTMTLIDGHRQWFKSRQGMDGCETSRGPALCTVALEEPRALVVPDTLADPRFSANPFVVGPPGLRFYAGVPLQTSEGHRIGTLCAMDTRPRGITEDQLDTLIDLGHIVMSELELRRLAMVDGLTGTLSRRAFREEFARALALAQRHRHDLACIMIDLDHFKQVNDRHGHATGDRVLAAAAAVCREELRKSDALGRLGGEEFAVLLPYTSLASALRVAEKLRSAIAHQAIPTTDGPIQVTASFGVAAIESASADGMIDLDALLQLADEALYRAKAEGRNQCRDARPAPAPPVARRRVLKAGLISYDGGRCSMDCTVRSLSDESASLKTVSTAGLPQTFRLLIAADGFARKCQVVTKADRQLDVAFV